MVRGFSNGKRHFGLTGRTGQGGLPGADLGGGCSGCAPPPPDDLRFSNTTGILQKKMWFIGVEVEQETSAPPPKKNPGSAPDYPQRWSQILWLNQTKLVCSI